jgi:hypothetical protein
MKLNGRDRYALQFALDQPGRFDAGAVASQQLRDAVAAGDEELARRLRLQRNGAIGWGLTLRRLAMAGLIRRSDYAGIYMYELPPEMTDAARAALA